MCDCINVCLNVDCMFLCAIYSCIYSYNKYLSFIFNTPVAVNCHLPICTIIAIDIDQFGIFFNLSIIRITSIFCISNARFGNLLQK